MRRRNAIVVAWAAVAMPGMLALSSCVQELPAGSPPEAGVDGATQDAPVTGDDDAVGEAGDAPADAGSDVGTDAFDAAGMDASEEADAADAADTGVVPDSGDAGDASSASDASDAGSANDASDAAPDASVSPCALVQSSNVCQGGGTCAMTLPSSSTAGDLLVVVFGVGVSNTPSSPPGWTQAIFVPGTGENIGIWYLPNNPGGITSVTMDGGGSNSVRGIISEWRNASHIDQVASNSNTSMTSLSVSTAAIGASGECVISAFGQKISLAKSVGFVEGGGWTHLTDNGMASSNFHITSDYLLSPPVAAVSETESTSGSGDWVGAIATFR